MEDGDDAGGDGLTVEGEASSMHIFSATGECCVCYGSVVGLCCSGTPYLLLYFQLSMTSLNLRERFQEIHPFLLAFPSNMKKREEKTLKQTGSSKAYQKKRINDL